MYIFSLEKHLFSLKLEALTWLRYAGWTLLVTRCFRSLSKTTAELREIATSRICIVNCTECTLVILDRGNLLRLSRCWDLPLEIAEES